ncbi:MAG: hypothetical protein OEY88_07765 [Candidatus Bathyarchaeota archaeon]|nr:hypothetical protein [Candidatus Bathyarchaeota archaeon]
MRSAAKHCARADFDLAAIILKGALASDNAEHIRFVEEITEIISYRA